MNIDKKALKSIVDQIEASRARQKAETEHQREVMKRAKAHQLDTKAVRIVIQRRAMGATKRDEQDYYVHAYEIALGGKKDTIEALERGASTREAARIGGISNGAAAALAKSAQKSSFMSTPPEVAALPAGTPQGRETPCGSGEAPLAEATDGPLRVGAVRIGDSGEPGVAPGPQEPETGEAEPPHELMREPDPDAMAAAIAADQAMEIPAFLDRRRRQA